MQTDEDKNNKNKSKSDESKHINQDKHKDEEIFKLMKEMKVGKINQTLHSK